MLLVHCRCEQKWTKSKPESLLFSPPWKRGQTGRSFGVPTLLRSHLLILTPLLLNHLKKKNQNNIKRFAVLLVSRESTSPAINADISHSHKTLTLWCAHAHKTPCLDWPPQKQHKETGKGEEQHLLCFFTHTAISNHCCPQPQACWHWIHCGHPAQHTQRANLVGK